MVSVPLPTNSVWLSVFLFPHLQCFVLKMLALPLTLLSASPPAPPFFSPCSLSRVAHPLLWFQGAPSCHGSHMQTLALNVVLRSRFRHLIVCWTPATCISLRHTKLTTLLELLLLWLFDLSVWHHHLDSWPNQKTFSFILLSCWYPHQVLSESQLVSLYLCVSFLVPAEVTCDHFLSLCTSQASPKMCNWVASVAPDGIQNKGKNPKSDANAFIVSFLLRANLISSTHISSSEYRSLFWSMFDFQLPLWYSCHNVF